MAPKFADFRRIRKRIKRTLGYGAQAPISLNFQLSQLVVDYFDKNCPFDYMKPETSTNVSRRGYADPCTLVVALVYLDRLHLQDKEFFESSDPLDLYLPALILASKYLHDSDTYDRVSNSDWAEAANVPASHLNSLEWKFAKNLDWDLALKEAEFEKYLKTVERWVANDFMKKNDFCTYNEISQMLSSMPVVAYLSLLKQLFSFIGLTAFLYTLSICSISSALQHLTSSPSAANTTESLSVPVVLLPPREHGMYSEPSTSFEVQDLTECENNLNVIAVSSDHQNVFACNRCVKKPAFEFRSMDVYVMDDRHILDTFSNFSLHALFGIVS